MKSANFTFSRRWAKIAIKELGNESEWNREEKLSKVAEMLKFQQQRHCFIKLDGQTTQPLRVPDVNTPYVEPETLDEYQQMLYERQSALPAEEVDRRLVASEEQFMERARAGGVLEHHVGGGTKTDSDEEFFG